MDITFSFDQMNAIQEPLDRLQPLKHQSPYRVQTRAGSYDIPDHQPYKCHPLIVQPLGKEPERAVPNTLRRHSTYILFRLFY